MSRVLPAESVRGRIRSWIERHADKLGDDVLEVGGRIHDIDSAWYLDNRYLAKGHWTVCDMQDGANVDFVFDIEEPLISMGFTGILCSEVLEHVKRPWLAIPNLYRSLRPGGWVIITVPFGFHRHAYPNDYYRYTDQGLGVLLEDAGFVDYQFEYGGDSVISIKSDDRPAFDKRLEMQLFAIARKPSHG